MAASLQEEAIPTNVMLLAARLLLAYLFLTDGFAALVSMENTSSYFADLGFPAPTLVAMGSGLFELIAGALVLVGLQARIASVLLAGFSVAAGVIGHYGQGADDPMLAFMHSQALMKDLAIAGGFLALAVAGPGGWSLDAWRR